jgi:hypothetical protein
MSQPTDDGDDAPVPDPEGSASDPSSSEPESGGRRLDDLGRYLNYGAIALLSLFALVAAFRFYFAASNSVSTWVTDEYVSIFQAAFQLVVLLVAVAGIAWQLRRLGE